MILGVEHYGLELREFAWELKKSPDGMTKTAAGAENGRTENDEFRVNLNELDRVLADIEK